MAPWTIAEIGTLSQHRSFIEQICDAVELLQILGPLEEAQEVQHAVKAYTSAREAAALARALVVAAACPAEQSLASSSSPSRPPSKQERLTRLRADHKHRALAADAQAKQQAEDEAKLGVESARQRARERESEPGLALSAADCYSVLSQRTATGRMDVLLRALRSKPRSMSALLAAIRADPHATPHRSKRGKCRHRGKTKAHEVDPNRTHLRSTQQQNERVPRQRKTTKSTGRGLIESTRHAMAHLFPEAAEEAAAAKRAEAEISVRAGGSILPAVAAPVEEKQSTATYGEGVASSAPAAGVDAGATAQAQKIHQQRMLRRAGLAQAIEDDLAQRNALTALFDATGGPSGKWLRAENWATEAPVWTWYGVIVQHGQVDVVDLAANGLSGHLPSAFIEPSAAQVGRRSRAPLPKLRVLCLQNNRLTGKLPPRLLEQLPCLEQLWLGNNQLCGPLPNFGAEVDTQSLDAGRDQHTETKRGSPRRKTASTMETKHHAGALLRSVRLDNNCFTGALPRTIGHLKKLTELELERNSLSGTLPPSLAAMNSTAGDSRVGLLRLTLHANKLHGSVPAGLLYGSDHGHNQDNVCDSTMAATMSSLRTLNLGGNHLSGELEPPTRSALRCNHDSCLGQLKNINLIDNRFTGHVPAVLRPRLGASDFGVTQNQGLSTRIDMRFNKKLRMPRQ